MNRELNIIVTPHIVSALTGANITQAFDDFASILKRSAFLTSKVDHRSFTITKSMKSHQHEYVRHEGSFSPSMVNKKRKFKKNNCKC